MLLKSIKYNSVFLTPYLIILLALAPVFLLYSKPDIHLWINQFYSEIPDWFFRIITFLGDGWFVILMVAGMLFFSLRNSIFILSAYLSTGLITQLLKRIFFEDVVRPYKYFQGIASLHLVDGVKMLGSRSFPSGHATSAFALFLCLAMISRNYYMKSMCFFIACLVAFSRVYLSQHFLIDIYFGSIIGCTGTIACYQLYFSSEKKWYGWNIQKALLQNVKG
jgi:membrane-associated phospholipid phosphatase